ncbi:ribosomal protein S2 [Pseudovirgaria hyperparasitica]|uniref:Ribosomal protein S2 n=1 Tax=Pseudovirgaria hyperparasitica TaxID=470096 RepID=A0A6A6WDQ7_9PEZI|nr:ribosomal protein S2 [Pseudovirgaria hyperparasitica]KAF2760705.1 ribosomal protein S2 [Pseudovirgaria hyperparasitica]
MILRRCLLRAGRRALPDARSTRTNWRAQSTIVAETTEPVQHTTEELQSLLTESHTRVKALELEANSHLDRPLPPSTADAALFNDAQHALVRQQFDNYLRTKQEFSKIGATQAPHYQPHTLISNPPRLSDVTLELLLASEAHIGHSTSNWNPMNSRYIFGIRQGVHIISLDVIVAHLRRAARVVEETARRGGLILFVGTRGGQERCVVKAAELAGGCHIFERWIPGSITNGQQLLGHCEIKVVDEHDQEVPGFDDLTSERAVLKPDLVVCLNPIENAVLLHECAMEPIPTIGIIDTNADPTKVTYPIPANDDSLRCVQVIAGVLGRAAESGRQARLEAAKRNEYTFAPAAGLQLPLTGKSVEQTG